MYQQKKTEYQRGYEDGEELVATHVNSDGKAKAKEYIQKLADKNKGKTDALNYFIDNSASYFVPPQFIGENKKFKYNTMNKKKIKISESKLRQIVNETVSQLLEYNDDFLERVANCDFLSDEDKRGIQLASMNNWDKHEREERENNKENQIRDLMTLSNQNVMGRSRRGIRESWGNNGNNDIMDAIIMLKEAYVDIQDFANQNRTAGLDLAEAMGNLRGAIKILNNIEKNKRQNTDIL